MLYLSPMVQSFISVWNTLWSVSLFFFFFTDTCESLHLLPHGRSSNCECRWCSAAFFFFFCEHVCYSMQRAEESWSLLLILLTDKASGRTIPAHVLTVVYYISVVGLHVWGARGPAAQRDDTTWVMASFPTWAYICLHSQYIMLDKSLAE